MPTVASPRSAGTAAAKRSRSAIGGASRNRGGASRSPATTSRSSGSDGSRSSTWTGSPGRGTWSASTTDQRTRPGSTSSRGSADRRPQQERDQEQDQEHAD